MTEQEAIIQLNFDMEMTRFNPDTGENLTLEQIRLQNEENYKSYLACEVAITALLEIQQYRKIGTQEECRAAVKRSSDDVCEWKNAGTNDNWKTSCEPNSTFNVFGVAWFNRCPYCGKKIKVVE